MLPLLVIEKSLDKEKIWTDGTGLRRRKIFSRPTNKFFGRENIVLQRSPVPAVPNFSCPDFFIY